MALRLYESSEHARLYQLYRLDYKNTGIEEHICSYLAKSFQQAPFGTAVDVGCGTGQATRMLSSCFNKVIGVDVSLAMIREAERATKSSNVEYRNSEAEDMPFLADESVDLVISACAVHWMDVPLLLKEINRVLKPGGCCVFVNVASLKCNQLKLVDDFANHTTSENIDKVFQDFLTECFRTCSKVMNTLEEDLPTPRGYTDVTRFETRMSNVVADLNHVLGLMRTFGTYQKICNRSENAGMMASYQARYEDELSSVSADPWSVKIHIFMPLKLFLSRKPQQLEKPRLGFD